MRNNRNWLLLDLISALRSTKNRAKQAKDCGLNPENSVKYWIVQDGVSKWEIQVTRIND